jgi:hypothetical protein
MPKEKSEEKPERLHLVLTAVESKKLNTYIIALVSKQRKVPASIKTRIGHRALNEWLENHAKDYNFDFSHST